MLTEPLSLWEHHLCSCGLFMYLLQMVNRLAGARYVCVDVWQVYRWLQKCVRTPFRAKTVICHNTLLLTLRLLFGMCSMTLYPM